MKKLLFLLVILFFTSCEENIRKDERIKFLLEMEENQFPPAVIEGARETINYRYNDSVYYHDVIFYDLGNKGAVMLHLPECKYCKQGQ